MPLFVSYQVFQMAKVEKDVVSKESLDENSLQDKNKRNNQSVSYLTRAGQLRISKIRIYNIRNTYIQYQKYVYTILEIRIYNIRNTYTQYQKYVYTILEIRIYNITNTYIQYQKYVYTIL